MKHLLYAILLLPVIASANTQADITVHNGSFDEWLNNQNSDQSANLCQMQEGQIAFRAKSGSLKSNVKNLLAQHYPNKNADSLVYKVKHHSIFSDICIYASNRSALMQKLIQGFTSPGRIFFMTFDGDVSAVFYHDDPEFKTYLRQAR